MMHHLAKEEVPRFDGRPLFPEHRAHTLNFELSPMEVTRSIQNRGMPVLIANGAAGEGVNLQLGHLMVNYELPRNPKKTVWHFGRARRIGQTEVWHLWSIAAADTREGEVMAAYWLPDIGCLWSDAGPGRRWP